MPPWGPRKSTVSIHLESKRKIEVEGQSGARKTASNLQRQWTPPTKGKRALLSLWVVRRRHGQEDLKKLFYSRIKKNTLSEDECGKPHTPHPFSNNPGPHNSLKFYCFLPPSSFVVYWPNIALTFDLLVATVTALRENFCNFPCDCVSWDPCMTTTRTEMQWDKKRFFFHLYKESNLMNGASMMQGSTKKC